MSTVFQCLTLTNDVNVVLLITHEIFLGKSLLFVEDKYPTSWLRMYKRNTENRGNLSYNFG